MLDEFNLRSKMEMAAQTARMTVQMARMAAQMAEGMKQMGDSAPGQFRNS